ncbi:MAG: PIN domain-containing protein [Elusimicrobia bacterium]|nr:PIN domain-containing protein [Elusimicrobiota bacterium]
MILVDTSVWIEMIRGGMKGRANAAFDIEEAVTCLPVVQEVLQGIRDEAMFRIARESLFSLPIVESPLGPETYERAVELYRLARRQGLTVRSSVDCLIAACALRHDLTVLHRDRDYAALARVSGLRERRL